MPNQRKKGKRMVGFFASEKEAEALDRAAKSLGMNVSDFLRYVIEINDPHPKSSPKEGGRDESQP